VTDKELTKLRNSMLKTTVLKFYHSKCKKPEVVLQLVFVSLKYISAEEIVAVAPMVEELLENLSA